MSVNETEETEEVAMLEDLPNELLVHISKYCTWTARDSLSRVNRRFRKVFKPTRLRLEEILVSRFFDDSTTILDIKMDSEARVVFTFAHDGKILNRSYFNYRNDPQMQKTSHSCHALSSVQKLLHWVMSNCSFEKITVQNKLMKSQCFSYTKPRVHHVTVWAMDLDMAIFFQPTILLVELSPAFEDSSHEPLVFPITKFKYLQKLNLRSNMGIDLDEMLDSNLRECEVYNQTDITMKHIDNITQRLRDGTTKIRRLEICHNSTTLPFPEDGATVRIQHDLVLLLWPNQLILAPDNIVDPFPPPLCRYFPLGRRLWTLRRY